MQIIATLMEEHRRIERVCDALLGWAAALTGGEPDAPADAGDFARWLQDFADHHHHAKEETMLFVAMVEAGMPREMGPIGVMLREHDIGRGQVHELRSAAERAPAAWDDRLRGRAAGAAEGFAELLRPHIMKEDNILYRMAEQVLSPEAKASLDAQAAAFEAQHAGRRAELEALGDALCARWSEA